jgi:hypothetical protein
MVGILLGCGFYILRLMKTSVHTITHCEKKNNEGSNSCNWGVIFDGTKPWISPERNEVIVAGVCRSAETDGSVPSTLSLTPM